MRRCGDRSTRLAVTSHFQSPQAHEILDLPVGLDGMRLEDMLVHVHPDDEPTVPDDR